MKFSQKINLGIFFISIILIFITVLLIYTLTKIQSTIRQVEELPELQAQLGTLTIQHYEWADALMETMFLGKEFKKPLSPRECDLGKWYYSYKPDEKLAETFAKLEEPHIKFHATAEKILPLVRSGNLEKALEIYQKETVTYLKQTRDVLSNLRMEVKKNLLSELDQVILNLKSFRDTMFILFSILIVSLIILSYFFIIKPLNRRLNSLIWIADSVAKGDFSMVKEKQNSLQ